MLFLILLFIILFLFIQKEPFVVNTLYTSSIQDCIDDCKEASCFYNISDNKKCHNSCKCACNKLYIS